MCQGGLAEKLLDFHECILLARCTQASAVFQVSFAHLKSRALNVADFTLEWSHIRGIPFMTQLSQDGLDSLSKPAMPPRDGLVTVF